VTGTGAHDHSVIARPRLAEVRSAKVTLDEESLLDEATQPTAEAEAANLPGVTCTASRLFWPTSMRGSSV
jgi:hypothetical protein